MSKSPYTDLIERLQERFNRFGDPMDKDLLQALYSANQYRDNVIEWLAKTDWIQAEGVEPGELGKHRADVLRQRITSLRAKLEVCTTALKLARDRMEEQAEKRGGHGKLAGAYLVITQALEGEPND